MPRSSGSRLISEIGVGGQGAGTTKSAMGELSFIQEYMCKVIDDEASVFPRALSRKNLQLDRVMEIERDNTHKYAIGFDPAHGLGQDYSVMVCLKQDDDGFIHLVNIWRRNDFPPDKQADMMIEWSKRYGTPPFAIESVGFQNLYESLVNTKGAFLDYRESKVSNRTLKQGLLNRMRVWFEREMIVMPFGDDFTRKQVNILLEELVYNTAGDRPIVMDGKRVNSTLLSNSRKNYGLSRA